MSDFTPEYIEMCRTCGLEWTPEVGDWVVDKWHGKPVLIFAILRPVIRGVEREHISLIRPDANVDTGYTNTRDKLFPLWSQEQLQGMVPSGDTIAMKLADLYEWLLGGDNRLYRVIPYASCSWTQLWFCYVMDKLHNRRWTGEGWEAIA